MASHQNDPRQIDVRDFDSPEELALHTMRRWYFGFEVLWVCGPGSGGIEHQAAQILATKVPGFDPSVVTAPTSQAIAVRAA